jgi:asparagine synthetase B (glutamine-hydrolysing)
MACSLELRAPFCDHRLVELVTSLPVEQKVIPGRQKPLLVDAVNDELVTETARRTKIGFVLPIESWLRQGLLLSEPRGEPLGLSEAAVARVICRFWQGQDFREYWTLALLARWVEDQRLLPPLN